MTKEKLYKIYDKDGIEMPPHWTGKDRTLDQALKLVSELNKNGEYGPYSMKEVK